MTARLPSLNGLRAFEAAARHLSFTNAASELNVTQTAISHQIRRLEEELGIRLFVRQNRALALTPEAKEYLPGIRAAFNDLRLATDRLLRKDNDHVLTVSTLASLAAKWLLPRLSAFQEAASRHRRPHHHLDRSGRFQERRRRCRDPLWPRPMAGPARRLADGRPVVSGLQPGAADGQQAAAMPGGSRQPRAAALHQQRRRLAALAHRRGPADQHLEAARRDLRSHLHGGAGRDRRHSASRSAGPPMSRTTSPRAAWWCRSRSRCRRTPGSIWFLPRRTADSPKLAAFRQWLIASAQKAEAR